jgi:hypothetical protein
MQKFSLIHLLLAVFAVACGVVIYDSGGAYRRFWEYDLTVNVTSASLAPIKAVSCTVYEEYCPTAQDQLNYLLGPEGSSLSFAFKPPTTYKVWGSEETSRLGRLLSKTQCRGMVAVVEYRDGRKTGKWVDIPAYEETQAITVEVP